MVRSDLAPLADPHLAPNDMPLSDSLVAALGKRGWRIGDDPARERWLRLAACHSTYLFECDQPQVSVGALEALRKVGATHLSLAVADLVVKQTRPRDLKRQNQVIAHVPGRVAHRIIADLTVVDSMQLGRGEESNRRVTSRSPKTSCIRSSVS